MPEIKPADIQASAVIKVVGVGGAGGAAEQAGTVAGASLGAGLLSKAKAVLAPAACKIPGRCAAMAVELNQVAAKTKASSQSAMARKPALASRAPAA